MTGIIDAHVHVWTDDFDRYPLAPGFTAEEMNPKTFTPEELLAHCRPSGVERIVLVQMSYYGTDSSYMLDVMRAYPGVFGGIAVIDESAADVEAEMDRLLAQGVRGFRIQPRVGAPVPGAQVPGAHWLDAPGYERMFAHAARTRQALCCLIDPDALPALDAMCDRFPDTPVVIDHLCRIGADGEIREGDVTDLCDMAKHPQIRVKVSAFYALGQKRPPHDDLLPLIERVYEAYGARRLMWASDCPFQVQNETYEDGLAPVRDAFPFASEEDREWVLRCTAEETFF